MEIKYTTDGKKVVVVGNLNSQEKIVQEIFVSASGGEIPAGENFVVKSLLDEPAESWKGFHQKRREELEKTLQRDNKELENKIQENRKKLGDINNLLRDRITWAAEAIKKVSPEAFQHLLDWLTNSYEFAVINTYKGYKVYPMDKVLEYRESGYGDNYKGLRLISVYGRSEGKFDYCIGDYPDASGGQRKIWFFKTQQQAVRFIADEFSKVEVYTDNIITIMQKYKIPFDAKKLHYYNENVKNTIRDKIKKAEEEVTRLQNHLIEHKYVGNE